MLSDKVKQHFNTAAQAEWERLDINEYYRLIFRLHLDFIKEELAAKPRVLDAGSGPGRYALEFAKRGCAVTLCGISDGELLLAEQKFGENDIATERFVQTDLRDLSAFPDGAFELTVCYGAPLSYITKNRQKAVAELVLVTRRGAMPMLGKSRAVQQARRKSRRKSANRGAGAEMHRDENMVGFGDFLLAKGVKK